MSRVDGSSASLDANVDFPAAIFPQIRCKVGLSLDIGFPQTMQVNVPFDVTADDQIP